MIADYFLYIDPATGSALLVLILSAAAGVGMFIKTKWAKIRYRIKSDDT